MWSRSVQLFGIYPTFLNLLPLTPSKCPSGINGLFLLAHIHMNMHTRATFGPDRSRCLASFPPLCMCDPLTPSKYTLGLESLICLANGYSQTNLHLLLFGRSCVIVGHHRLTDELFPTAAIFCSPYALCCFWPTINPFLANKGAQCENTIMIRVDEKIITDASQVSQHMNSFYVNVASTIGENIDVSQKSETNVDFVSRWANHFDKHPSIVDINSNMNTTAFSFRHTTAAKVEQILRGLNAKKPQARTGFHQS